MMNTPGNWISSSGPFFTSVPPIMRNPELLVGVDVLHGEMHVSHPDADLVRLDELGKRGRGAQQDGGKESEALIHGSKFLLSRTICVRSASIVPPSGGSVKGLKDEPWARPRRRVVR